MALSIEKIIHNLNFDRLFLDRIDYVERQQNNTLHGNGIPFHYIAMFKLLLVLPDNKMEQGFIAEYYKQVFGKRITQSSMSRTLTYLAQTLGLLDYVSNAHKPDARFTWLRLTALGKKFQQHLIGSTSVAKDIDPKSSIRNVVRMMPMTTKKMG
jgi:hypothetical protein